MGRSAGTYSSLSFRAGRKIEVPVGHVTNGVHMPTWDSAAADDLWTKACGKDRWLGADETLEQDIRRDPGRPGLWQFRAAASKLSLSTLASDCPGNCPPAGAPPEAR